MIIASLAGVKVEESFTSLEEFRASNEKA